MLKLLAVKPVIISAYVWQVAS